MEALLPWRTISHTAPKRPVESAMITTASRMAITSSRAEPMGPGKSSPATLTTSNTPGASRQGYMENTRLLIWIQASCRER